MEPMKTTPISAVGGPCIMARDKHRPTKRMARMISSLHGLRKVASMTVLLYNKQFYQSAIIL
jgi:hypothetical protein